MNIDELKNELRQMRAPKMDLFISSRKKDIANEFFKLLKKQEKRDERYILQKRIIPILVGLIVITLLIIIYPITAPIMCIGCFLMIASFISALILLFIDYKNISKEKFNATILEFLQEKEKRLTYWRSTHFKYHVIFSVFILGWFMLTVGNNPVIRDFGILPFLVYVMIILLMHVNSERLFRKRHKTEHEPILKMISEIREEL